MAFSARGRLVEHVSRFRRYLSFQPVEGGEGGDNNSRVNASLGPRSFA